MSFNLNAFMGAFGALVGGTSELPIKYAAYLPLEYNAWKASETIPVGSGGSLCLSFMALEPNVDKYFFDGRGVGNSSFLIVNPSGAWDWAGGVSSIKVDGVDVPQYTLFTQNDGEAHTLEVFFNESAGFNSIGVSQWESNWFSGYLFDVLVKSPMDVLEYKNTLGNKDAGGIQTPVVGTAIMSYENYDDTIEWHDVSIPLVEIPTLT